MRRVRIQLFEDKKKSERVVNQFNYLLRRYQQKGICYGVKPARLEYEFGYYWLVYETEPDYDRVNIRLLESVFP